MFVNLSYVYNDTSTSAIQGITLDPENVSVAGSNLTDSERLERELGPKHKDMISVVFLLITYSLIFVSGIVGNTCTCIVIIKNKYMQTTTNFYLFSLAISDILILVSCLPYEAYSIWEAYPFRFGEVFCIVKAQLTEMTSYASILTITAFTVERYVAICFPLKSHKFADLRRSVKIIMAIWIVAIIFALPYPIHTRTLYYIPRIEDSLVCNIPRDWQPRMVVMFQFSTFLFFVLPMTVITILYILIAITLRRTALNRANSEESTTPGSHSCSHSVKVVLRMLVAVVVAFFTCWAPFHTQRLYTIYHDSNWTDTEVEIHSHLFYISGVLYFVGSTVNPILYNLISKRYREAFRETLCCCCGHRKSKYQRSLIYYYNNMKSSTIRSNNTEPLQDMGPGTKMNNSKSCLKNTRQDSQECPMTKRLLSDSVRDHSYRPPSPDMCKQIHGRTFSDNVFKGEKDDVKLLYFPLSKSDNADVSKQNSNLYHAS